MQNTEAQKTTLNSLHFFFSSDQFEMAPSVLLSGFQCACCSDEVLTIPMFSPLAWHSLRCEGCRMSSCCVGKQLNEHLGVGKPSLASLLFVLLFTMTPLGQERLVAKGSGLFPPAIARCCCCTRRWGQDSSTTRQENRQEQGRGPSGSQGVSGRAGKYLIVVPAAQWEVGERNRGVQEVVSGVAMSMARARTHRCETDYEISSCWICIAPQLLQLPYRWGGPVLALLVDCAAGRNCLICSDG